MNKEFKTLITREVLLQYGFTYIDEEEGFHDFFRLEIEDMFDHSFDLDLSNTNLVENINESPSPFFSFYCYELHFSFKYVEQLQMFYTSITGKKLLKNQKIK